MDNLTQDRLSVWKDRVNRGAIVFLALLLAQACVGDPQSEAVLLPACVSGVQLGMTERELKASRPNARPNASSQGYIEVTDGGSPFISTIEYRIEWGRLSRIQLWRSWQLHEDTEELRELGPGLVHGALRLWGEPARTGAWLYSADPLLPVCRLEWYAADTLIAVQFPPPSTVEQALESENYGVPLQVLVVLETESNARGMDDLTAIAQDSLDSCEIGALLSHYQPPAEYLR